MSERGSFVTEFIYCPKCFEKMKTALIQGEKYLDGITFKDSIIAGKIGGLGRGDEFILMELEIFDKTNAPCHPVRIAVLSDTAGSSVYTVNPDGNVEELCHAPPS
jgi:hypothetical protein